jgi:hypothetical protein
MVFRKIKKAAKKVTKPIKKTVIKPIKKTVIKPIEKAVIKPIENTLKNPTKLFNNKGFFENISKITPKKSKSNSNIKDNYKYNYDKNDKRSNFEKYSDHYVYTQEENEFNQRFFSSHDYDDNLLSELSDKIQYIDRDNYESFIRKKSPMETLIHYGIMMGKNMMMVMFAVVITTFIILQIDKLTIQVADIQPDWGMVFIPFLVVFFILTFDAFSPIKILF